MRREVPNGILDGHRAHRRSDNIVARRRDSRVDCPDSATAKLIFTRLRMGQLIDEDMLRLLTGKKS
jgi:hypothetical protein